MKSKLSLVFLLSLALPMLALAQNDPLSPAYLPSIDTNAADYASNIWITDSLQKVRQDNGTPGTQHWGTFYGTQNEFIDFQVHFHDTGSGTPNLNIIVSNFVQSSPASSTISAATANVLVYREAYMNVTQKTATGSTYYNATGFYPDILVPTKDPYWHQTTNAWPFSVAASKNQSAWVDVLVPPTAPSGYYLGSVTVKSGATVLTTMPVILAVWQWPSSGFMPSTTTLKAEGAGLQYSGMCTQMYVGDGSTGATAGCSAYPDSGGNADGAVTQITLDGDMLMKDHRFGSGGPENVFPQSGSFSSYVSTVGPIMNGTCTHGGTTCPLLAGSKSTTKQIDYFGSASSAIFSNFKTNFASNGWGSALYDYLCDEPPNGCSWSTLNSTGSTRHGYLTPAIPELVTTDIVSATAQNALNNIDIMVANIPVLEPIGGPLQNLSSYATWVAGPNPSGVQRQFWTYQSCSNAGTCGNGTTGPSTATWPNYNIDGRPAANRVMEWLSFLHGNTGELYYATDICMAPASQGANCGYPTHPQDPWISVYYSGGWGDGTLLYAGGVAAGKSNYMGAGVTTPLILPSVRLKHIRDGMQDYEYLAALENAGKNSFVQQQISSWITNSYTFETSGSGLRAARMAIGKTLHQLSYPAMLLPPPSLNGTVQ